MEKSGETLGRVARVFFGLVQADTNDARQKIQEEIAPKLAAHEDEINLDPKLFERVKTIYDQRDTLDLDPVQKRLVERDYDNLVRAGAQLSDADKATMRKLNIEESTLSTKFHKSEHHTSELQSLMRITSAVFRLKTNTHYRTYCSSSIHY